MEEEAFEPESLALGPNLSSAQNLSVSSRWGSPGQPALTIVAATILLLALVGNSLLLHRLRCGGAASPCCCGIQFGRRRKMDFLLAHLAVADLYGCGLALLPQLPPRAAHEAAGGAAGPGEWLAGDAACRLLRLLQGSGLLAPAHMLVLLALERRHAATASAPALLPARGALAALGWLLALLLALPQAFVFRRAEAQQLGGAGGGGCLSIFARLPPGHGQAYAVYGAVTGFVAPACLLGRACGRILWALSSSRAKEGREEEEEEEPAGGLRSAASGAPPPPPRLLRLWPLFARCALSSPPAPRPLPRAHARSLQLALALAALFALCGFPRVLLELGRAFGPREGAAGDDDGPTTALGNFMAAAHTALNPYVCLVFHSHRPWARRLQRSLCRCPDGQPRRRARHRHGPPPPPSTSAERPGRWLCPCQNKQPSAGVQREEAGPPPPLACESGF